LVEEITAEECAAGVVAPAMCPRPLVGFRRRQLVFYGWNEMFIVHLNKMEISDRINRIDRIRFNPVYPVNTVKRFD